MDTLDSRKGEFALKHSIRTVTAILMAAILAISMFAIPAFAGPAGFDEDGEFKILLLSDLHQDAQTDPNLTAYITDALNMHKPDLVLFLGDNSAASHAETGYEETVTPGSLAQYRVGAEMIVAPVLAARVPFTYVCGETDLAELTDETKNAMGGTNADVLRGLAAVWREVGKDLFYPSDAIDDSEGLTQAIHVRDSEDNVKASLYLFDLGATDENGYTLPTAAQIDFFNAQRSLAPAVPAYVFMHAPLPEVFAYYPSTLAELSPFLDWLARIFGYDAFTESDGTLVKWLLPFFPMYEGVILEKPDAFAPASSEAFAAFLADGSVAAVFSGRDHLNAFKTNVNGIDLVSIATSAWNGADASNLTRGATVVTIPENNPANYSLTRYSYCKAKWDTGDEVLLTSQPGGNFGLGVLWFFESVFSFFGAPLRWFIETAVPWLSAQWTIFTLWVPSIFSN
jgi:hypothetical protein